MWHSLADRREEPRSPVFAEETPSYWAGTREGRSPYDWQDEPLRLPAFAEGVGLYWADRREESPLQHWLEDVQPAPRGRQVDCAATGRGFRLSAATVRITNTAKFLKIRKRVIAFLLLTVL